MQTTHAATGDDVAHGLSTLLLPGANVQQHKKQSLLGGTIAEKFGGSSKDILEEE